MSGFVLPCASGIMPCLKAKTVGPVYQTGISKPISQNEPSPFVRLFSQMCFVVTESCIAYMLSNIFIQVHIIQRSYVIKDI